MKSLLRSALAGISVSLAVALSPAGAQPPAKGMHRIGFLSVSDASSSSPNRGAFIDGMRQFGYQEGKDYSIEPRYAEGKLDRLPALAAGTRRPEGRCDRLG